ncbi:MAG: ATP-binding cassette domain-containing protein [Oscillospiraceae bacterium]|nr:ATP-binding cassette domain-containing protein [Oscillospiraceae bacterium]
MGELSAVRGESLLRMQTITKEFPGVRALDKVSFDVAPGEIHALVGENGAGKSTLMNVLSGIYPHGTYEGDIVYDGEVCRFGNIRDSEKKGIVIIHQELALVPYMTIAENMFLGNERGHVVKIDWDETNSKAAEYMRMVGLNESPQMLIKDIGVGKQQLVEIAKALAKNVRLLILDEPTAALNEEDSKNLLEMLLRFKKEGMTSIIISHKLNEVEQIADSITVLRDGATIETLFKETGNITEERIIKGMVGREINDRFPKRESHIGEVTLEVKNWTAHHPLYRERKVCDGVNLTLRRGEVVGISGLMGAGRTELAMSIFGRSYGTDISGELLINDEPVIFKKPRDAIDRGLAYVTEDRKGDGLILSNTLRINTTLANLARTSLFGLVLDKDREIHFAEEYKTRFGVKAASVEQNAENLSGGNQQKLLLSKWMFTEPEILILDEPTRGIDVGAKYEIYNIINELVADGKSVLFISSDMPELIGMCDRIYVMNEGRMVDECINSEETRQGLPERIMTAILRSSKGA